MDGDGGDGQRVFPEPRPSAESFLGYMQQKFRDFASSAPQRPGRPTPSPIQQGSSRIHSWNGDDTGFDDRGEGPSGSVGRDATPITNDSPLRRAGLLQPRSYTASAGGFAHPHNLSRSLGLPHTHSQDTIRQATMELSAMPGPSSYSSMAPPQLSRRSSTSAATVEDGSFIFPLAPPSIAPSHESSPSPVGSIPDSKLDSSLASLGDVTTTSTTSSTDDDESNVAALRPKTSKKLSGLSLLRPTRDSHSYRNSTASCTGASFAAYRY
ncbi:hypothetical protein NMY22_g2093 [Coprinellus aureogranulatus]|nr:hypothetical protein NMY22_g2093 [Coprinellus aureogranulatus]